MRTGPAAGEPAVVDLLGVGAGPFNLSLAALADGVPGLDAVFLEQRTAFRWHPGMLVEGASLQVPFLADLVSLVDPTSRWSFLNYLRDQERLFPFYFAERFHVPRAEYDAYCRWVSGALPSCRFGHRVDTVRWDGVRRAYEVAFTRVDEHGAALSTGRLLARNLALGVGTAPHVPAPLRALAGDPDAPVLHSAEYLAHRDRLLAAGHVTVVGAGQSGAEVLLDLLRARPAGREGLAWLARTPAFAPMEYSRLGLEHFTPDHTRYFRELPEAARDRLLPAQWQLYKGVSARTLSDIHDELYRRTLAGGWPDVTLTPGVAVTAAGRRGGRVELALEHREEGSRATLATDAVVLATGYARRPLDGLLGPLGPHVARDGSGRPLVDHDQRLVLDEEVGGAVFVQNAEHHTHGVGTPDLGLAAWRSAVILNALTGRPVHPLPRRTAFTTFGLARTGGGRDGPDGHGDRNGRDDRDGRDDRGDQDDRNDRNGRRNDGQGERNERGGRA
ncbi:MULTISPECIES: lysine N(6)-hydroxylase/L-ornithine N(5)-oxygenase family protein [Streptomyces]|uniref:L-lysine N6-monooxygenase MbtG n=1 Tax=Streptomyces sudanensis TaxID=436397 RepID=A0ABY4TGX0_9ACTN|nr:MULTISPECIES: SidA/IucD/PvdA family monooxygenase [Streptomyces]URN17465.1 SidA/IucD/PvdA family monooxygenase [Streptomyces sudanensis]